MKNEGYSIYLGATFERNFKSLLDRTTINYQSESNLNNRVPLSQNSIEGLGSNGNLYQKMPPQSNDELKKELEDINKETDDILSNIEKIKIQISNFQANNSDYNKIRPALTDTSKSSSSFGSMKFGLTGLIMLLTFGLLLGAWIDKILS